MNHPLRLMAGVAIAGSVACGPPPNTRELTAQERELIHGNIADGQRRLLPPVLELAARSNITFGAEVTNGTSANFVRGIERCNSTLSGLVALDHIRYGTSENGMFDGSHEIDAIAYFDDNGKQGPTGDPRRDYIIINPILSAERVAYDLMMHEACHQYGEHSQRIIQKQKDWTPVQLFQEAVVENDLAETVAHFISGYEYTVDLSRFLLRSHAESIASNYERENNSPHSTAISFAEVYLYLETTPAEDIWVGDIQDGMVAGMDGGIQEIFSVAELDPFDIQEALAIVEDPEDHRTEIIVAVDEIVAETQELAAERGEQIDIQSELDELYEEAGLERSSEYGDRNQREVVSEPVQEQRRRRVQFR